MILVCVSQTETGNLGQWVWLLPATYLIHLVEEVWGGEGYAAWITRLSGSRFPNSTLLWLPLGLYSIWRGLARGERSDLWLGIAIGLVATAVISLVALNPRPLPAFLR